MEMGPMLRNNENEAFNLTTKTYLGRVIEGSQLPDLLPMLLGGVVPSSSLAELIFETESEKSLSS